MERVKMKKTRDPERSRRRLLEAATQCFARRGYDGVTVDEVVAKAKINKRMVYHYFGNKEGLYLEVLREVFGRLESVEIAAIGEGIDVTEAIRAVLRSYFEFLSDNPEFVKLLQWENLNEGRFIRAHPDILTKNPVVDRLSEILRKGQEAGIFRDNVEVRQLLILMIGVCFIYFSNRHTLSQTLAVDLNDPQIREKGLRTAETIMLRGLMKTDPA